MFNNILYFIFNNIIYFIIVLLIYNISYAGKTPENSLNYTLGMLSLSWLVFAAYCRWGFQRLVSRFKEDRFDDGGLTSEYHGLVLRLSILAIFLFALDVYVFYLKYWLQILPGFKHLSVLQGALALALFLFYMGTIWYFSHTSYAVVFNAKISRGAFIVSNLKLNMPILFPWLLLSLAYDVLSMTPWAGPEAFLNKPEGQFLFFASFLTVLMIFMPGLIQYWWGCGPFEPSEKVRELKGFLKEKGFKYRNLLKWPIFEGRIPTAGIMGIVARYRYILITGALMEILSVDELKAVVAHEMGHAKYRHLLFYILFILGFMALSFGLFDVFFYFFAAQPFFIKFLETAGAETTNLFQLLVSVPILVTIFVYFRYVMGFFMRNFERQADLHSAVIMGSPRATISSLEKIAVLSGKSRKLPSWHHFSIKERVDYLWRTLTEPGLVRRHHRFVALSFFIYLVSIIGLGYLLNFGPVKQKLGYNLVGKTLKEQIIKDPENVLLHQNLAMVYHEMGKYEQAIRSYERVILLDPSRAMALNNLAWLLVTVPEEALRDRGRALALAKKAVDIERSPIFLDTLAEAYYANGLVQEAIDTIKEAISVAKENRGYYKKQLKKYKNQQGKG